MTFSAATGWARDQNALAVALERRRAAGLPLIDLVESNPTRVGLGLPFERLREALAAPGIERYEPHPQGIASAREAVARDYAARGAVVDPGSIVLTASTSEAYAFLFKLLCDPGDRVLTPCPGYPLFDFIGRLERISVAGYALRSDAGAWRIDLPSVEAAMRAPGPPVRLLVVVNPGNPTGAFVTRAEREALESLCARHDVAIVADEVFSDYAFAPDAERVGTFAAGSPAALTFVLSGLSKVLAAPQLKLGWIRIGGPPDAAEEARARLEIVADTFLSVSTPVQLAAPRLLAARDEVQGPVRARLARNAAALRERLRGTPVSALAIEGGWYAVLRVPRLFSDEAWTVALVDEEGVHAQPGGFFDFAEPGHLVVSLLPTPAAFDDGIARLVRLVRRNAEPPP